MFILRYKLICTGKLEIWDVGSLNYIPELISAGRKVTHFQCIQGFCISEINCKHYFDKFLLLKSL